MKLHKQIPNALTCGNIICGSLALIHLEATWIFVLWMMGALFFDFIDGLAARLLNAQSAFGKQLDSLADMLSFGLVPGIWIYTVLDNYLEMGTWAYIALSIPVGAALRLAKFNIDTRQSQDFRGLPTPAAALFFISWISFVEEPQIKHGLVANPWLPIVFILGIVGLMVSDIRLFSLKFEGLSWKKNYIRYVFLVLAGLSFFYGYFFAIPLVIILYILLSLVYFIFENKK